MNLKSSNLPEDTLRIIVRAFFSDLHIIIVDLILRDNYITEYSISTELKLSIDRTRLVTNNLINEKLINFEERLFKNLNSKIKLNKIIYQKGFKLRYLYFDKISFVYTIKKKFRIVVSRCLRENKNDSNSFLLCPRKICNKIYEMKETKKLSVDNEKGGFVCTNILNFNIICGSKLINGEKGISTKIINLKIIKTLAESMDFSNYRQIGL
jgi:transcription initiation factor IIE alpha subunit|mmetsp:Transcript_26991/g.43332  ORF Transcript_26991/g.43332 Transcript_26991/m.43332 type:complete len:210 (-) Transcript_26991:123-752(-)